MPAAPGPAPLLCARHPTLAAASGPVRTATAVLIEGLSPPEVPGHSGHWWAPSEGPGLVATACCAVWGWGRVGPWDTASPVGGDGPVRGAGCRAS